MESTRETVLSHGGCGSSSLRECIELLNNTERQAPAPCHSRVKMENRSDPRQVMSPNVEESQSTAKQTASGSVPSDSSPLKEEPQTRTEQVKSEASTPKIEPSTTDVKEEIDESDTTGQVPDALQVEAQDVADAQPLDSEDSLSQEHVASELRRLADLRVSATLAEMRVRVTGDPSQDPEGGAVTPIAEENTAPMTAQTRQGAVAPDSGWNWEDNESYAPQRSGRYRGRLQSPDPYMFNWQALTCMKTLWIDCVIACVQWSITWRH